MSSNQLAPGRTAAADKENEITVRGDSMGVERQQGVGYRQLLLFEEAEPESVRHDVGGEGGTRSATFEELQASAASEQRRAFDARTRYVALTR